MATGFCRTVCGMDVNGIRLLVLVVVALIAFPVASGAQAPYLSGGTGADERQELLAKEGEFNLKIVTADTSGDYLANVQIAIESAKRERVLEAKMEGPILLVKLAPGTYTIRATSSKKTQTRSVTVPAQGPRRVDFRWPPSVDDEEE